MLVQEKFSYLINYGFKCVQKNRRFVKYVSKFVFIEIDHDSRFGELGANIGLIKNSKENNFSIQDIVHFLDINAYKKNYTDYPAYNYDKLIDGLDWLDKLFKKYAKDFLLGDLKKFSELSAHCKEWAEKEVMDEKNKRIRIKAEEAFRNRKYDEVIRLYSLIENELKESERKKLAFSRKRI